MHSSDIRQIHSIEIFYAILTSPGISQRELIELTGFDKSTVSLVVGKLKGNRIVETHRRPLTGQRGRPAIQLRISNAQGLLVGVHFEFEKLTLVATSIGGHVYGTWQSQLPTEPNSVGKSVKDALRQFCSSLGKSIPDIDAIGVSVPGQILLGREVVHSANLHWDHVRLLDQFEEQLQIPFAIGNDTHAAALSEHYFGCAVGMRDFVFIKAGLGVGGAIFWNGNLLRGEDGFAGEIGHTQVISGGRRCHCGAIGCLAAYLSLEPMRDVATEVDTSIQSIEDLQDAIARGNPAAIEPLREASALSGLAVANVINMLNPPKIIVAGTLARYWNSIEKIFMDSVKRHALEAPLRSSRIIVCDNNNLDTPLGGVALALERHVQAKGSI